ncbi:hypothetical protein T492DRAFT_847777 [Pavlovales sp. CCMP2436]|nr:hypothetical protein T492DRAFT_847777 [Pavlovales sp. CCMP2436]
MGRLDVGSAAIGATVGVLASTCAVLVVWWHAERERRKPILTGGRLPPQIAGDPSAEEAAAASRRLGVIPTPIDMTSLMNQVLRPPLDARVASMLEATSLCYLSTFSVNSGGEPSPHLSLMRFSYVRGEEVSGCVQ